METMRFRAIPARGLTGNIDRENGIISGIAVVTMGEALGHGVFLDEEFVDATVKNGNALKRGLKSRFGHPNMSSSAVGTLLGSVKNFRKDTSNGVPIARGDLHLSQSAKTTPNGDLFTYVLDMAEHDPDQFGTSIVFKPGKTYKRGDDGQKVFSNDDEFSQLEGDTFVIQEKLTHDDIVDEPAANPGGLFSAFSADQPAAIVTQFLEENPAVWGLIKDLDADQVFSMFDPFRERYSEYSSNISYTEPANPKKEPENMAKEPKQDNVEISAEEALETAKQEASLATAEHLKSLLSEFPQETAMAAFEAGKTVNDVKIEEYDALKTQCVELKAEIADLKSAKKAEGEESPVEFEEEEQPDADPRASFEAKVSEYREQGLGAGEAFRKAIKDNAELAKKAFK